MWNRAGWGLARWLGSYPCLTTNKMEMTKMTLLLISHVVKHIESEGEKERERNVSFLYVVGYYYRPPTLRETSLPSFLNQTPSSSPSSLFRLPHFSHLSLSIVPFSGLSAWPPIIVWERFRASEKPMEPSRIPPPLALPKSTANSRSPLFNFFHCLFHNSSSFFSHFCLFDKCNWKNDIGIAQNLSFCLGFGYSCGQGHQSRWSTS